MAVALVVIAVAPARADVTTMRTPAGEIVYVPEGDVQAALAKGYVRETPVEREARLRQKADQEARDEARLARLNAEAEAERDAPRELGKNIAIAIGAVVGLLVLTSILWSIGRRPRRVALGTPASAERLYAPDGSVSAVPVASVEFALRDGFRRIPKVDMRSPEGQHVLVDEDQVTDFRGRGYWPMTPSEVDAMRRHG